MKITSMITVACEGKPFRPGSIRTTILGEPERLDQNLNGAATPLWGPHSPDPINSVTVDVYAAVTESDGFILGDGSKVLFEDIRYAVTIRNMGNPTPDVWEALDRFERTPVWGGHRRLRPTTAFGGLYPTATKVVPGWGPGLEHREVSVLEFYQAIIAQVKPVMVNQIPLPEFMVRDAAGDRFAFDGTEISAFRGLGWPVKMADNPDQEATTDWWKSLSAPQELFQAGVEQIWFGVPAPTIPTAADHYWTAAQYNQVARVYESPMTGTSVWGALERGQSVQRFDRRTTVPVLGQPAEWPSTPTPTPAPGVNGGYPRKVPTVSVV